MARIPRTPAVAPMMMGVMGAEADSCVGVGAGVGVGVGIDVVDVRAAPAFVDVVDEVDVVDDVDVVLDVALVDVVVCGDVPTVVGAGATTAAERTSTTVPVMLILGMVFTVPRADSLGP